MLICTAAALGNAVLIYVYATRRQFKNKSYTLLSALAFADMFMALSAIVPFSYRLVNCAHGMRLTLTATQCMAVLDLWAAGLTASCLMDFLLSVDRLIAILRPIYHAVHLHAKYTWSMIGTAIVPAIILFGLNYYGLNSDLRATVCTVSRSDRNCVFLVSEVAWMVISVLTMANCALMIPATK